MACPARSRRVTARSRKAASKTARCIDRLRRCAGWIEDLVLDVSPPAARPHHRPAARSRCRARLHRGFTHLRTGVPCGDRIGLLNVLLAEVEPSLRKMARLPTPRLLATSRLARWHVEARRSTRRWPAWSPRKGAADGAGLGYGSHRIGRWPFFPTARRGEAMNTVNARYGNDPASGLYPRQRPLRRCIADHLGDRQRSPICSTG